MPTKTNKSGWEEQFYKGYSENRQQNSGDKKYDQRKGIIKV